MAAAVAAILALVLVVPPVLLDGVPAEETAERYLEAVVAGDAETVREHLAPQDEVLDIALTKEVLTDTRDPIEHFSIDEVSIDDDSAEITDQGTQQLSAQLVDSLEECAGSTAPRPAGCPLAAPTEISGPGSWELIGTPEVFVAEQDRGFIVLMVLAAAEFTVAPGGDGTAPQSSTGTTATQAHQVEVEAHASAMLDRDGRFHTDWLLRTADGDGVPEQ